MDGHTPQYILPALTGPVRFKKQMRPCWVGMESGRCLVGVGEGYEYDQDTVCAILKELIKVYKKKFI